MERMTDYKPQERQDLEELYRKQNVRIYELEQCNLNLQEWLDNKEKVNKSLREDNKKLNIKVASLEGEIKGLNYTIDRLHKEIEELEKPHPKFSDFGGYYLDK